MFHGLTETTDSDYDLAVDKAALVLDGGNAVILTEEGDLLEGPVNADGSVTPREGEFYHAEPVADFLDRSDEMKADLIAARNALESAATGTVAALGA